jgi:hypothetical protein
MTIHGIIDNQRVHAGKDALKGVGEIRVKLRLSTLDRKKKRSIAQRAIISYVYLQRWKEIRKTKNDAEKWEGHTQNGENKSKGTSTMNSEMN